MGKSNHDETTSSSMSSKDLEKLEKKFKKAEEKMKKAEEKMRVAKEEYEKAQAQAQSQTLAQKQVQEEAPTKGEKKEKKDKKRKRDKDEVEQEPNAEHQSVEVEQVDGTSKIEEQQQDGDGEKAEKKSKKEKKDKKDKKKKTKLEKALEAEATSENNSSNHAKSVEEEGGAKGIFEDGSLSDQAKKNIYYAHLYSISRQPGVEGKTDGVNWKFSKAKQNWLIRNIFSSEEIPDKYVELVLDYLKTIQGLSKTNLIQSANKIINPPAAPAVTGDVQVEGEAKRDEDTTQEQEKKDTEQAEQVVLPLPDAEKAQSEQIKENLQKERAERLLSIMQ
ncbi:hypothetical protein V866_003158 [Kwoniella sp. B9012]|uniref:WKF domain-containing protein n=1 Tax=Kwoniella europaea PYCC6329 TaxID=1423913 RepID=A0AAX4KHA8_9TREE